MSDSVDPFDQVRRERDPLRQAKRAGELISLYQQRSVELARLRKEAIERAADESGMTFSAVADALGVTRSRVSQIRKASPPGHRAFFGVGPVTVAVPGRTAPGRPALMIASEDASASLIVTRLLESLTFEVAQFQIPQDGEWTPSGDVVAICGPKSSPITARALEADPILYFGQDDSGKYVIRDRKSGAVHVSPMDDDGRRGDIAYVGRLPYNDAGDVMLVIAGIHAIGSVGAATWLSEHLPELYGKVGSDRFSMAIRSEYDESAQIISCELAIPPRRHA